MNRYFIEYPNKNIYVYFDGKYALVNLKFKYMSVEYLFAQLVVGRNKICDALKRIFKLKDKSSDLYLLLCMVINKFNIDPKKHNKREFEFTILPERDKDLIFRKDMYPIISIFTNEEY